ncbi:MAG: acyl carrier protein [Lachnospiraceae bacterium]|nr:acyl carrier protein [Lachnospiraceae bacterium]
MDQEFIKIKEIIADVLNVDPNEITEDTTFADDLGADSLDLYQILMGIEEEFGITVDQEKAEKVTTVKEALDLIKGAAGEN